MESTWVLKLVLLVLYEIEREHSGNPILSDRPALDALVYTARYASAGGREMLETTREWHYLRSRMMQSLATLYSPRREWLVDNGTRLMPSD